MYEFGGFGVRGSRVKYPGGITRIKSVDIPNTIITDIDEDKKVFEKISK